MHILLLNQCWFAPELIRRGHSVIVTAQQEFGTPANPYRFDVTLDEITARLSPARPFDRIVYHDDSHFPWVRDLHEARVPTVFFSVDTHHHALWHSSFGGMFDETLVAQKDYLAMFREKSVAARWFPLWAMVTAPFERARDIPVSFRGTLDPELHPERMKFFSELSREVEVDVRTGRVVDAYPRSRIVVNQSVRDDVNFRVFEAMGCGALLVTPRTENGLPDLFQAGSDVVLYENGDARDAAAKIRFYLEHEEERRRIAASGHEKVRRLHTAEARAAEFEKILQSLNVTVRPLRHFAAGSVFLVCYELARTKDGFGRTAFLEMAAAELFRSVETREESGAEFALQILKLSFYLEEESSRDGSFQLIAAAAAFRPYDEILAIRYVQMLIERKNLEAAQAIAAFVSPEPEYFRLQAPILVEQLRQGIVQG